jgi:NAD(P)-dependent dehydrogenase (short-subunit alcohol dehydrogenase family)
MMNGTLSERVVLVTGVTSGIGRAITERLLAEGASVLGVGRDAERLGRAAAEWGARFQPLLVDLSRQEERSACLESIASRPVDALINNAAFCVYEQPSAFSQERWRELIEVNLLAAVELAGALGARMPPGGQIINLSSVTARQIAHPRFGPYAVTKAAIEHFSRALAMELAPRGVSVSLLVPGLVDTPIYGKVDGFDRAEERLRKALPQWLTAEDVAEAAAWMLSRPARVVAAELVLLPRGQTH